MRNRTVQLHQVDLGIERARMSKGPITRANTVICSFDTQRFGYFYIACDGAQLHEYKDEPDLNMFSEVDKKYIRCAAAIAWRMTFDTVAQTERFE